MEQQAQWRILLRENGTGVIVVVGASGMPHIVHWGRDLGPLDEDALTAVALGVERMDVDNVPDIPLEAGIIPGGWTGWSGRPGLVGHREDRGSWSPRLRTREVRVPGQEQPVPPGSHVLTQNDVAFSLSDEHSGLAASVRLRLGPGGVMEAQATVTNAGDTDYHLDELTLAFPVPLEATEYLDFTGHWGTERTPQRSELTMGCHLREHRRGRPGFDATTVLLCGKPGFDFRGGEVFGLHTATGANSRSYLERLPEGMQVLAGGELLQPGEVVLSPGESYSSPVLYLTHGDGLDEAARRFHRWARSSPSAPGPNRPVTLNVWEAVGFDHSLDKLLALADLAKRVGVERYVLDDGWFLGRRGDAVGLGDWEVDPEVWPQGLHPLTDHVTGLGMEFGLWFEPEMVSPDSELARSHPEWILAAGPSWPTPWRNQQVLNLTIPEAREHIWSQMDAILNEYPISYIKWDFNRDVYDAGCQLSGGRPVSGAQARAAFEIMDRLRADHPGLEIESCSSGGGRIDLEMVRHAQRFWVSDCIDPHERQSMFRWTSQLIPPEFLGTHVASGRSQTTGRQHDLSFRAATAVWGHMGVEWDLTEATDEDLAALEEWFTWYKTHRELLLTGDMVRDVVGDDSMWLHGVVSQDQNRALFQLYAHRHGPFGIQGRLRFPGLDPRRRYRVTSRLIAGGPAGLIPPPWCEGLVVSGAVLGTVGVTPPDLFPEQALLLEVEAVPEPTS